MGDRAAEIVERARALQQAGPDKEVLDRLFAAMNVLDLKSQALMRFNGVFLALLTGFWALVADGRVQALAGTPTLALAAAAMLAFFMSAMLCFAIMRVRRRFLSLVRSGADGSLDFAAEAHRVAAVLDARTWRFMVAWTCSLTGTCLVVLSVILALTGIV